LNAAQAYAPDNPFNPVNRFDPGNPVNQYHPDNPLNPANRSRCPRKNNPRVLSAEPIFQ
jgi:hypothetical protein